MATPGAARSGLTRPSKARPREENGAIEPSLPLRTTRGTPIEIAGCSPALSAVSAMPATRSGTLRTGTFDALVEPEAAGRQLRPVDDDRGGPGPGGVLGRELGSPAPCTSAARPATRLRPWPSKKRSW